MHTLVEELTAAGPVVTDGAWGTQMQARGLEPGACPDAWNLAYPDRVEEVARAYVEAGSQVIITNTFQANRLALERHGLAGKVAEINRAGVELSRRGAAGQARVFASIGPTGKVLITGETTEEELRQVFAQQAQALAEAGADAIVIESMSDPAEATIALAAAKETGLPIVACMTFDSGKDFDRTSFGTTPEKAAEVLTEAGADAVGSNCGHGVEKFAAICRRLKSATDRPIWIKANAGLPELVGGKAVWADTPERFASFVPALVEAGASFIGGCCGTSPAYIRAICEALSR